MKILIFILTGILTIFSLWAEGPFESVLPEVEEEKTSWEKSSEEKISLPDWVVVEAVLWGSDLPQTIIDGEVYSIGDRLKNLDATIFKIKGNIVYISYAGKILKKGVGKREVK